jgi:hypothetical protein
MSYQPPFTITSETLNGLAQNALVNASVNAPVNAEGAGSPSTSTRAIGGK